MEIKKISWTPKNGMKISYNLIENEQKVGYVKKSDEIPTLDFQNALQDLKPHLLILTEYIYSYEWEARQFERGSETDFGVTLDSACVTEVQLTGDGEEEKVIIIGKKELQNKLTIPLKTLKTTLYNSNDYVYSGNLAQAVEKLVEEAKLYLDGKHQDKPKQQEINFEKQDELEEEDSI